jgi:hypothetical protein
MEVPFDDYFRDFVKTQIERWKQQTFDKPSKKIRNKFFANMEQMLEEEIIKHNHFISLHTTH